ncbi:MAG: elongation factor 1-beta [Candidatus Bathyarchaeota archaeon]|nr:MAG: elongation factor 1-beta [Candidatus Bathyarchaeota archaeon]
MSKIVATIKIFPEDVIISPKVLKTRIENALPNNVSVHRIDEEPIAFGLIALIAYIVMPETSGVLDEVESALSGINGISQIETLLVRKI